MKRKGSSFHSTKEGFKGGPVEVIHRRGDPVSIPLRKVSRVSRALTLVLESLPVSIPLRKVSRATKKPRSPSVGHVSIPLRKVSR